MDAEAHQYAARLSFDPVLREDMNTTFTLLLINAVGEEKLSLRVGADAPPPPPVKAPKAAPEGNDGLPSGTGDSKDDVDNGKDELKGWPACCAYLGRGGEGERALDGREDASWKPEE